MARDNLERLRAVYEQWGRGNFRAGAELWDRRVMFIPVDDLPDAGEYVGPRGVADFMRAFLQSWESFTIVAVDFVEAGDSVVVVAHQRGVSRGSDLVADLPQQFQVWTFRGSKAIRFEAFRHRADALAAVGLRD